MFSGARHDAEILQVRLLGGLKIIKGSVRRPPAGITEDARPDRLFRAVPAPVSARRSFCDLLWDDVSDPRRELRWSLSKPGFYLVHG
jgi:hypothetical protein